MALLGKLMARIGLVLLLVAMPASLSAQDNDIVSYRMEQGDTLNGLDRLYMRGGNSVARVARLNRIFNPRRIPVGTEIRLPREVLAYRPVEVRVAHFTGQVTIDGATPQPQQILEEGAVVRTGPGGFVSFRAGTDGTISLPSNAHARLERARVYNLRDMRDVEFRILGGRGEVNAPTLREGERWRTSTPQAVTAVRGTIYRVGYAEDAGLSVTEVVEGAVAVSAEDTAAVSEGFGITATGQGLGEQEALLPPVEIEEPGAIQTAEQVSFMLTPPAGAVATRTQIATDAGFLEIIAQEIAGEEVSFTDLPDGRYFVRSRAISESGLEGLPLPIDESFRRKRLGSEASVEASPIDDGYRFAWAAQGEGVVHFAFQLWRDGESGSLLYDEIALPGSATVLTGLEPGIYVWRVAAVQADEEEGLLKIWGPEQRLRVSPE